MIDLTKNTDSKNIYHYRMALATGLSEEKASLFATAMTHSDAPDLSHLRVIKQPGCIDLRKKVKVK